MYNICIYVHMCAKYIYYIYTDYINIRMNSWYNRTSLPLYVILPANHESLFRLFYHSFVFYGYALLLSVSMCARKNMNLHKHLHKQSTHITSYLLSVNFKTCLSKNTSEHKKILHVSTYVSVRSTTISTGLNPIDNASIRGLKGIRNLFELLLWD